MRVFDDRSDVREFWARAYFGNTRRFDSVMLLSTRSAVSKYLAHSVLKMSGTNKSFILYSNVYSQCSIDLCQ